MLMTSLEALETPRLRGRRVCEEDAAALRRASDADPRVMATLGGRLLTEEESRASLSRQLAHWARHGFGLWVFSAREGGGLVGRAGLQRYVVEGADEVGLLYHLAAGAWGRGFATEIAGACLRVGFEDLGLPSIASWTLPWNRASRRVMEECGLRYDREGNFAGFRHVLYRISAGAWRARRA
ncbi:MAG: GNAT family N-acetyltransferase [Planctomycetota bacterium]